MPRKKPKPSAPALSAQRPPGPQTVRDTLRYLSPRFASSPAVPDWPPDVFAVAASILHKSGGYIRLVSDWPPRKKYSSVARWIRDLRKLAGKWRDQSVLGLPAPAQVQEWWDILRTSRAGLHEIMDLPDLCDALLQLAAVADEASAGAGIPEDSLEDDSFQYAVRYHLAGKRERGATLCKYIDKSKLRVLPKLHVPQSGMTIRSISHHLALCPSADVETDWYWLLSRPQAHFLNLLLLPWPLATTPSHFAMSGGTLRNMPKDFGFFSYGYPTGDPAELCEKTDRLIREGARTVGRIDGVILPELALLPAEFDALKEKVSAHEAFLLSGVRENGVQNGPGKNYLKFHVPVPSLKMPTSYVQHKHHRWQLDRRQIVQYGLGGTLDPSRGWWEHMTLKPRKLAFFAMRPWLTLCALICEDLARQDPVAEILRAVGPNLVVALLMDGPQLAERWSSRYATVLADDPGSSVLTLTSLGMTALSRPPDLPASSRVVGLWKDASTGKPIPLTLPEGAEGLVLSLVKDQSLEWTADGRNDAGASASGTSAKVAFGGVHPIFTRRDQPHLDSATLPQGNSVPGAHVDLPGGLKVP